MGYRSHAAANEAARPWYKMMPKGWTLHIWENLGWHWSLHRGPMSIYNYGRPGHATTFSCLIDSTPNPQPGLAGGGPWTPEIAHHGGTPLEAARRAVRNFRKWVKNKQAVLATIDAGLTLEEK